MQYAQRITFKADIVLVAVYKNRGPIARRFAPGQVIIGTIFEASSDGHATEVVTLACDGVDNDNHNEPQNIYNGTFVLANVPATVLIIEDLPE